MRDDILKILGKRIDDIISMYGEPTKISTYGNCVIISFANNKKYVTGLRNLFKNMATLD